MFDVVRSFGRKNRRVAPTAFLICSAVAEHSRHAAEQLPAMSIFRIERA
jgi:hypothetical protein